MTDERISRRMLLMRSGMVAFGSAALSSCTVLSNVDTQVPLYSLKPQLNLDPSLPKVSWQLVISAPNADADLDTARIALRRNAGITEYFANAAWIDTVPNMLQSKLLESFERTGCVAVGRDTGGLIPDYILQTELRDFQAEYGGTVAGAHIRLVAKLVRMTDRKIIRTIDANQRAKSSGTDMSQVIAAFQQALGPVLSQIVNQTLTAVPPQA
jgi:cholesterol transport system auxiliary component